MKSEAIVLPYYGIGDFLTHLPFILALLKKNKKSKFIVLTKSRTFAKKLLLPEKRIEVIYIQNNYNLFSSIKEFFKLINFFKKKKNIKNMDISQKPKICNYSFLFFY